GQRRATKRQRNGVDRAVADISKRAGAKQSQGIQCRVNASSAIVADLIFEWRTGGINARCIIGRVINTNVARNAKSSVGLSELERNAADTGNDSAQCRR